VGHAGADDRGGNLRKLHDEVKPRYVITRRLASRMNKTKMMDLLHRAGLSSSPTTCTPSGALMAKNRPIGRRKSSTGSVSRAARLPRLSSWTTPLQLLR